MTVRCWLILLVCTSMVVALCPAAWADSDDEDDEPVSLSWRLIDNRPDNRYRAELVLTNHSPAPLAANWVLYFNSSSRIVPGSVSASAGFQLEHVNGDFYAFGRPQAVGP